MQINKKLYTTLIIAMLAVSTIALTIPAALALPVNAPGLSASSGNVGDKITVTITGATPYGLVELFWDSLGTKIAEGYADGTGAATILNVVIPEDIAGDHDVVVKDDLSSGTASSTYEILSKIDLSASKALPGDGIDVAGTGFGDEAPVELYLNSTSVTSEPVADDDLDQTPVIITTVELAVVVNVNGTLGGSTNFVNNASSAITVVDNGKGILSGSLDGVAVTTTTLAGTVNVTIAGTINYATGEITLVPTAIDGAIAGDDAVTNIVVLVATVSANYDYALYKVTPAAGVTTTDVGSFDETISVPAIAVAAYGNYSVIAIDSDANTNSSILTIDYYLLVDPTKGPAGIEVELAGRIPAGKAYEIRLGSTVIATGTSGADTTFRETHTLSSFLALGDHTFSVYWDTTEFRTAIFELTNPPQVTFSTTTAMAGTTVTISTTAGYPFSANANITLYIDGDVVNSTELDERFGPTVAFGPFAGTFTDLEFVVPALAPDTYSLVIVDQFGASTGTLYTFTVSATPETTIALSGTSYTVGETISFTFSTTDTSVTNIRVTIADPSDLAWFTADDWAIPAVGVVRSIAYQDQLYGDANVRATLPDDAPLGSWNWTIMYDCTADDDVMATGLFTVAAKSTLGSVTSDIADLAGEIADISGDIATIRTDIGNVEDLVENLDITELTGDLATIQSSLGTLTVSVDALEATVTAIAGDVATVDTTLGTLEGTITGIEGNIATIETSVGTLEADISDIKGNVDNTPAWIAVVLALVAAVAAIFAVITIRQKIAG